MENFQPAALLDSERRNNTRRYKRTQPFKTKQTLRNTSRCRRGRRSARSLEGKRLEAALEASNCLKDLEELAETLQALELLSLTSPAAKLKAALWANYVSS